MHQDGLGEWAPRETKVPLGPGAVPRARRAPSSFPQQRGTAGAQPRVGLRGGGPGWVQGAKRLPERAPRREGGAHGRVGVQTPAGLACELGSFVTVCVWCGCASNCRRAKVSARLGVRVHGGPHALRRCRRGPVGRRSVRGRGGVGELTGRVDPSATGIARRFAHARTSSGADPLYCHVMTDGGRRCVSPHSESMRAHCAPRPRGVGQFGRVQFLKFL